jgi:hypothetical protein
MSTDFPGQGIALFNEGVSGERVTEGLARLPGVLASRRPGGFLLLEGYNTLQGSGRGPSVEHAPFHGAARADLGRAACVRHTYAGAGLRQINPAAITGIPFARWPQPGRCSSMRAVRLSARRRPSRATGCTHAGRLRAAVPALLHRDSKPRARDTAGASRGGADPARPPVVPAERRPVPALHSEVPACR